MESPPGKSALSVSGGVAVGATYAAAYAAPANGLLVEGNVGIGTRPSAKLSVVAPSSSEVKGDAMSKVLRVSAGNLGTKAGDELVLATIGFTSSSNNVGLGIRARRTADPGTDWKSTAIGLGMDVDDTGRPGGEGLYLSHNGNVGIGTADPKSALSVMGGLAVGATYAASHAAPEDGLLVAGAVGIGTTPSAKLSVLAPDSAEVQGGAMSKVLRVSAGNLGTKAGDELVLATIGFTSSSNNVGLGIRARRTADPGTDWKSTAIGLGMDVDDTGRPGGEGLYLSHNGNVGIGTADPKSALSVMGGLAVGATYASPLCCPGQWIAGRGPRRHRTNLPKGELHVEGFTQRNTSMMVYSKECIKRVCWGGGVAALLVPTFVSGRQVMS